MYANVGLDANPSYYIYVCSCIVFLVPYDNMKYSSYGVGCFAIAKQLLENDHHTGKDSSS